jgi:hypothetical protein
MRLYPSDLRMNSFQLAWASEAALQHISSIGVYYLMQLRKRPIRSYPFLKANRLSYYEGDGATWKVASRAELS